MNTTMTVKSVDHTGKTITTYVVYEIAKTLEDMEVGDVLEVFTTDFEPFDRDLAAWCAAAAIG